jgi:hypothetical protein
VDSTSSGKGAMAAVVNVVMNPVVPLNMGGILTSSVSKEGFSFMELVRGNNCHST